ncbi:probable E3 ubiquitin-protein ligase HECTD2 [Branchiostoma lanceolatum]|uniref:probable E3 ubiquitin-protein ligase HECTD2 n=1 Tax=Branchiostoma lanceolatum TaxID=7740 RepID=UPI0034540190
MDVQKKDIVRDEAHFAVPGKPPLPTARRQYEKRGSLPTSELARAKLPRPISQPRLQKNLGGGSLARLNLDREKSSSLVQLSNLKTKTLSSSNLAAVSDSNLSVQEAAPLRSYETPHTAEAATKVYFEQLVKRYFYQLTEGCGNKKCKNKFCHSCPGHIVVPKDMLAMISIELATRQRPYLCSMKKFLDRPLPSDIFHIEKGRPKPFLHTMFSCSPFLGLFKETPEETSPPNKPSKPRLLSSSSKTLNIASHSSLVLKAATSLNSVADSRQVHSNLRQEVLRRGSFTNYDGWSGRRASTDCVLNKLTLDKNGLTGSSRELSGSMENILGGSPRALSIHSNGSRPGSLTFGQSVHQEEGLNSLSSLTTSPSRLLSSAECLSDQSPELEEFERECMLEMSSDDIREFSLTHLTLPMLQDTVDKYRELGDPSFLLNTIRTVFTSSQALNDSFKHTESDSGVNIDLESLRKAYHLLCNLQPQETFKTAMANAVEILLSSLRGTSVQPNEIAQLILLMENPLMETRPALLHKLCQVVASLPHTSRSQLARALMKYDKANFRTFLQLFQAHLVQSLHPDKGARDQMLDVARTLSVFHLANSRAHSSRGKAILPLSDFYCPVLARKMDYKHEYGDWTSNQSSMLDFPYLLDPSLKVRILHFDAVVQMRKEYQNAILHQARVNQAQRYLNQLNKEASLEDGVQAATCPFLVLEIRRDQLIQDTLAEVQLKKDQLKKPLKIKYIGGGEQGLDMGGLQKEFFQMITESVFDPNYGMFVYLEESRSLWINGESPESDGEFELVGIILGLAIYNGVILDVHFPMTVYKKLQGETLELADLQDIQPTLASGLQELLNYEGDVEMDLCYTFQVSYESFGHVKTVDLIENGSEVPVNNKNRGEFVRRYVNFLLVDSVERQFEAFSRGFHLVCGGRVLTLFRAEEIELLICGSTELDFDGLEASTVYEDGYSKEHKTVRALWSVVRSLSHKHKKMLLMFITGSDRVPLKGLSTLRITVQRHGSDSERLPTAMTCFNTLLLPSYKDEEKLKNRLLTAIENCKGFGLT